MDLNLIDKTYQTFAAAPGIFIAWTIIVAGAVGTLTWFVRRTIDAGTIDALRERLELRREAAELAKRLQETAEADLVQVTSELKRLRSHSLGAAQTEALQAVESHTASATTSVASLAKIYWGTAGGGGTNSSIRASGGGGGGFYSLPPKTPKKGE